MTSKLSSYYFIINPNAGIKTNASALSELIKTQFKDYKIDIGITKKQGHAISLARRAKEKKFQCIVVVGGDGTINEILPEMVNSDVTLGIIPKGSGNGFARELGLKLYPYLACKELPNLKPLTIDAGKVNDNYFINAAGVGFDASVGNAFEKFTEGGTRGRWPYFFIVLKQYLTYKPAPMKIQFDSTQMITTPLLIAFSNSKQYGSDVKISPKAKINDGFFDLTIVPYEKFHKLLMGVPSLWKGKVNEVKFVKSYKIKKAHIKSKKEILYHTDGEIRKSSGTLDVEVVEKALKILVPKNYKP
ncbi:MAG TPA: diacylglycerol kinase family protein [Elusimicrobiales bacterium]|nr:diacylglycerol kinase family protein [Elusimicrobiales bacterium]